MRYLFPNSPDWRQFRSVDVKVRSYDESTRVYLSSREDIVQIIKKLMSECQTEEDFFEHVEQRLSVYPLVNRVWVAKYKGVYQLNLKEDK